MTDVYVISGFLGAGKTTLIKTMVRSALRNKKIVVIENDFGEAGIDAGLLKECSLAVTGLSDGCICCSLAGDFEKAMERILKDYAPDAVLVEPSGVGRLSDIIKICLKQEDRGLIHLKKCRLPRYLTKPRQRRSEWDMAGSDGISRVSAVFRGKSLLTNKMRII